MKLKRSVHEKIFCGCIIFLIIIISFSCYCKKPKAEPSVTYENNEILYPLRLNRKYGYIDYKGNLKIPFVYSTASKFSDETAAVSMEGEYFLIDKNNSIIKKLSESELQDFDFNHYDSTDFFDLPEISLKEDFAFDLGTYMGENFFRIHTKEVDYSTGVIDIYGNIVLQPIFVDVGDFSNGMAPFKNTQSGISGYLRKDGKIFYADDYIDK